LERKLHLRGSVEETGMTIALVLWAACDFGAAKEETLDEKVDAFLEAHDLHPEDCGSVVYGEPCGATEEASLACIADAWAACTPARFDATFATIEGDPIRVRLIVWENGANCQVQSFVDATEDAFATQEITEEVCYGLEIGDQDDGTCAQARPDECYSACEDRADCG
jgi:hypothetical protein